MLKLVLTNLKDHSVLNVGYFCTPWKCKIKFATSNLHMVTKTDRAASQHFSQTSDFEIIFIV